VKHSQYSPAPHLRVAMEGAWRIGNNTCSDA
jgi:hypothetical protein